jgi:uncharacterized protein with HEPN domain
LNPHDRVRLRHMAEALRTATRFIEGRTRADLESDDMLRLALVQAIAIVGEAASKVSDEARTKLQEIPWPLIVGMRNRLIHAYFDVNTDILWETVAEAGPPIAARINEVLGENTFD